jgi:hypothetical protein
MDNSGILAEYGVSRLDFTVTQTVSFAAQSENLQCTSRSIEK